VLAWGESHLGRCGRCASFILKMSSLRLAAKLIPLSCACRVYHDQPIALLSGGLGGVSSLIN
jgi:hypothetical protein